MKRLSALLLLASLLPVWGGTNEGAATDVVFTAKCDGTEQRCVLLLPAGFDAKQPHDVLIALHGHGSDRWQMVRDPRDEYRAVRDMAAARGMICVSPDYRATTSWMGQKAEADVLQIIDELKKNHRVARVFLCGGSMGGTSSLAFAAMHPELIAGVASMNGTANLVEFAGFPEAIAEAFGGSKTDVSEEYRKRSAEFWPDRFTMPVGLAVGGKDDIVPPQSVGRLADKLKALGRDVLFIHREEGGHSTSYDDARAVLEFAIQKASPATGLTHRVSSGEEQLVNVASPVWGTQITASSAYSDAHAAANVADGSVEQGHGWLSIDNAPLPQTLTFAFVEPFLITQIRVRQVKWTASMYRTKDFRVEGSADGKNFYPMAGGTLADNAEAEWAQPLTDGPLRAVRIVVLSSYTTVQTCGLGEVELMASLPVGRKPTFASVSPAISWRTLRGMFKLSLHLDPPAPLWCSETNGNQAPLCGKYTSGPYELTTEQSSPSPDARIVRWRIRRTDGQAFKLRNYSVECKTSYSGVYKILEPGSLTQQNYKVDLPFRIVGGARAEIDQPVIWMQQTDGRNTLTLGLLNQVPQTGYDGSTYDPGNGGESPGIANSYVRAVFNRPAPDAALLREFTEALYVNANPDITWFEALESYGAAVDAARSFKVRPVSEWAFNPMWHSWYAHGDQIHEKQIRDDARLARALGATTIELDAGWNIPRGVGYEFETEGDYIFAPDRFPNPQGMIHEMHAAGQRVILHVAPLIVGSKSKAWEQLKDCRIMVNGKPDAHLDPRLKKVYDYLLASWEYMFTEYGIDGLWYDFLELPHVADAPTAGMEVVTPDLHVAYTQLMQALFNKSLALNSNAVIILRRASANLNAKTYCTHVWPMDTPQDYNMNRRDIVYMKSFGPGVLTHACCTSWAISESDVNVARQMASITLAGVPAFSFKLAESPASHNAIVKAWLTFYEANSRDLMLGRMIPLLPTPPSAALRIEGEKQAFFGFFEAVPGLVEVTKPVEKITLVNAFSKRTATRLEGVKGKWQAQVFDQVWKPLSKTELKADAKGGLDLNFSGPTECHVIVLTKKS